MARLLESVSKHHAVISFSNDSGLKVYASE